MGKKAWKLLCYLLIFVPLPVSSQDLVKSKIADKKLRICVVEGTGLYKKGAQKCPTLEAKSDIECVYGVDRLDCLRKIQKGTAHFGVFSPEDLLAARWIGAEILVTSELRFHKGKFGGVIEREFFEYQIVAVVDKEAHIKTARELKGSKFCHPGHQIQKHWTEVLADYFETKLVPRECEDDLSPTESRIKAVAKFFGPSCKAGPWVSDPEEDRILKFKYPSLCQLCYKPYQCGIGDKHWGRRGPLYCLTSGAGEVAWVRLDDVKSHFGFSGLPPEADPAVRICVVEGTGLYKKGAQKCPTLEAKSDIECVYGVDRLDCLRKIQKGTAHFGVFSPEDLLAARWIGAEILVTSELRFHKGKFGGVIEREFFEYQIVAVVDKEAHIKTARELKGSKFCHPGHQIQKHWTEVLADYFETKLVPRECEDDLSPTESRIKAVAKFFGPSCKAGPWEVASVYGVEPKIQCMRADTQDSCLKKVQHKVSDVVIVDQDTRLRAESEYKLKPILYEYSSTLEDKYVVVAVIRAASKFKSGFDLRGKKACFPHYGGAAYLSVFESLMKHTHLIDECTDISSYFSSRSCKWHSQSKCSDVYKGEEGAMRCLLEGKGDVAFISYETYKKFKGKELGLTKQHKPSDFTLFCPFTKPLKAKAVCYLKWVSRGHVMISRTASELREKEIYKSLREIDRLLGKKHRVTTVPFTLYGEFDRKRKGQH
uniref:Transferrin n=1 Tax=Culex pipiens pallens TaxID=42434 RepID=E2GMY3_CULPA|nr:transferrin [Culex pipiens pallens]